MFRVLCSLVVKLGEDHRRGLKRLEPSRTGHHVVVAIPK